MPEPKTSRVLGEVALDYWRTLWASPMAVVYEDVDVFPLSRLVDLVDERDRVQGDFDGDAEVRQLEDRFGLSPLARRRLQWEVSQRSSDVVPVESDGAPGDRIRARLRSVS